MVQFNPNATLSHEDGLFGLPYSFDDSKVIIVPVPWEVTTSYGGGTSLAPSAILRASPQIDLYDVELKNAFECGIHMIPPDEDVKKMNAQLKPLAQKLIFQAEHHGSLDHMDELSVEKINMGSEKLNDWVFKTSSELLDKNKIVGIVGGDHSSPFGSMKAHCQRFQSDFGVLQIDAHADLREAYQGFQHSHASVMRGVMDAEWSPKKLVQVGVRDFCEEELNYIQEHSQRIDCFFDRTIKTQLFEGKNWSAICDEIIAALPNKVYVSLDIDGLRPEYARHTGTPVPGGMTYDQTVYLLSRLNRDGKTIIGFDLNEVVPAPDIEYEANVGARLLYHLCGWSLVTQGHYKL